MSRTSCSQRKLAAHPAAFGRGGGTEFGEANRQYDHCDSTSATQSELTAGTATPERRADQA